MRLFYSANYFTAREKKIMQKIREIAEKYEEF